MLCQCYTSGAICNGEISRGVWLALDPKACGMRALYSTTWAKGNFLLDQIGKLRVILIEFISSSELSVEKLKCSDTFFRFPKNPLAPTPPPHHVRGGWKPPPAPKLTYASLEQEAIEKLACNPDGSGTGSTFAITVSYNTMHNFLPDANKQPITQNISSPEYV